MNLKKKDLKVNKLQISRETLNALEAQGALLITCGTSSCITCHPDPC